MSESFYLLLGAVLFAVGFGILITKKNLIMMLMGAELIFNAANLNLIVFARKSAESSEAYLFTLFIMIVAAAEVSLALAIILKIKEKYGTLDPDQIDQLKN